MRKRALLLLALGLLSMTGDALGSKAIKALGAATGASPAPKVFSSVRGLETFSTRFFIEWQDGEGRARSLELTPEKNALLAGPYNRRNVYGAALAFGPVLHADPATRPLAEAVTRSALGGDAPLLRELGVAGVVSHVRVRFVPREGTLAELPFMIEVSQ